MLDTNLPLPSGDFMCLFLVGAGLGRLMGHGFVSAFPGAPFMLFCFFFFLVCLDFGLGLGSFCILLFW